MWSDRLPETRRRRLIERLREAVPGPRPHSRGSKTPLRSGGKTEPSPLQVAEELREQEGFAWLDGAETGHRIFIRPLAVLSVRNGQAVVTGSEGQVRFKAGGFDLLDAVFSAWEGAGATLAGYLGYEMGGEIESLPAPPPDDLGLP